MFEKFEAPDGRASRGAGYQPVTRSAGKLLASYALPTLLQASGPASSPSALCPAVGNRCHLHSWIEDLGGHAACTGCVAESFIVKCTGPATACLLALHLAEQRQQEKREACLGF